MNLNPPWEKGEKEQQTMPEKNPVPMAPSPSHTPFQTSFASVSLHLSDRIRLIGFPESDIVGIEHVVHQTWTKGIQDRRVYAGSYEFKVFGNPWYKQRTDAVSSRILLQGILAYFFSKGWILHASTDVSNHRDTLVFRRQQAPPPPSDWFSITFHEYDRLRLIGASTELTNAVRQLLQDLNLLQKYIDGKDRDLGAWEFKLNGFPWVASKEEEICTRFFILRLLELLEKYGWSLYASIDPTTADEKSSETDTWYCVKDQTWVPGMAVFHR